MEETIYCFCSQIGGRLHFEGSIICLWGLAIFPPNFCFCDSVVVCSGVPNHNDMKEQFNKAWSSIKRNFGWILLIRVILTEVLKRIFTDLYNTVPIMFTTYANDDSYFTQYLCCRKRLHTVRVWQLAYVTYIFIPTLISVHMILDMCMLTCMHIFSLWFFFSNFVVKILYCLKTYYYIFYL